MNAERSDPQSFRSRPLILGTAYLILGLLWLGGGDMLATQISDPQIRRWTELAKGIAFVLVSAAALWWVARPHTQRLPRFSPPNSLGRAIAVGYLSFAVTTLLFVGAILWQTHRHALYDGEQTVAVRSNLVADQTFRTVKNIDLALLHIVAEAERLDDLVRPDSKEQMEATLRALDGRVPVASEFSVADLRGQTVANNIANAPLPDLARRDYFTIHAGRADVGLFFGSTLDVSGRRVLSASRAIRDAGGRLRGVAIATVNIGYLEDLYSALGLEKDSSVSLYREDGLLIFRSPRSPTAGSIPAVNRAIPLALAEGDRGIAWAPSGVDGITRVYGFARLPEYPQLISTTGTAEATLFAQWRQLVATVTILWSMAMVVLGAMAALLSGQVGRRERLDTKLGQANRALRASLAASRAIAIRRERDGLLKEICDRLVAEAGYVTASVIRLVQRAGEVEVVVGAGPADERGRLARAFSDEARAISDSPIDFDRPIIFRGGAANPELPPWAAHLLGPQIGAAMAVPVTSEGGERQLLAMTTSESGGFDQPEVEIITALAKDLEYALRVMDSVTRYEAVSESRDDALARLKLALTGTVRTLSVAVEKRDPYTAGHQTRTALLGVAIAQKLGLDSGRCEGIRFGGMLHDIGKLGVPAEILTKPGRLNAAEMAVIREHPAIGYDIVKDIDFGEWPIARIVHEHHERFDGTGYPLGLKGEEICLEARILAVADTVEAMQTNRPYRLTRGLEAALATIDEGRGTVYDPAAVDACIAVFRGGSFKWPELAL